MPESGQLEGQRVRSKRLKVWDFLILLEGRSYRMIVVINE